MYICALVSHFRPILGSTFERLLLLLYNSISHRFVNGFNLPVLVSSNILEDVTLHLSVLFFIAVVPVREYSIVSNTLILTKFSPHEFSLKFQAWQCNWILTGFILLFIKSLVHMRRRNTTNVYFVKYIWLSISLMRAISTFFLVVSYVAWF